MTLPLVSLCIPTRNRLDYLKEALDSALAQTYSNIEVVVSDNVSEDGTRAYLNKLSSALPDSRLRVLLQPTNLGMVGNFNACLEAATGEYFMMLSDDDVLESTAVERMMKPFLSETASHFGISWSPSMIIDATGKAMWQTEAGPETESPVDLLIGLFNGKRGTRLSAILIRRGDSLALGGYDEARHGVLCDTGNWGRVGLRYPLVHCAREPLVRYRVHAASLTQVADCRQWQMYGDNMHQDFLDVLNSEGMPEEARRLKRSFRNHLSNITVTVLLRFVRTPGWIQLFLQEGWRSRRYLLTPFVAKRFARDGWKLLRVR